MKDEGKKGLQEDPPMFVESLMTPEEWKQRMIAFPKTSGRSYEHSHRPKPEPFKWRFGMGKNLSSEEIKLINSRIENLKKLI